MKVVVLSYNHPELTARTVRSVQKLVADSMILLVHNGSQLQHQTSLQESFPGIEHLLMPKNKGFPGGANAGLSRAFESSEWVLFLTNDCQLHSFVQPDGAPSMVAPLIWGRKEGRVDSLGGVFDISKAHLSHCKSIEEFGSVSVPYVPGTAFWLHRDVFAACSGFDESFEMYWEDVDFSLRAAALGFPLQVDDRTRVLHAIGKTCHKHTHYTTYLFQRNRKRVSLKYASSKALVSWHLGRSWASMSFFHLRRRNWDRLKLLARAIRD